MYVKHVYYCGKLATKSASDKSCLNLILEQLIFVHSCQL